MFGKKKEPEVIPEITVGRNEPCPCGSGKKYKKCCLAKHELTRHAALEKQWTEAEKAAAKAAADKKPAEQTSAPSAKPTEGPRVTEHRRNTFVPHQVNMPRRSGGG